MVCIPSGVTEVERRAVEDAARQAGSSNVELIEEPMVAAIGAGLLAAEPMGSMVVDIGGGTSKWPSFPSAISRPRALCGWLLGTKVDEAIVSHSGKIQSAIGERTAGDIKIRIGSAYPVDGLENAMIEAKGRNLLDGLPKNVTLSTPEIREALAGSTDDNHRRGKKHAGKTPPELAADIIDHGIMLTGGGAAERP